MSVGFSAYSAMLNASKAAVLSDSDPTNWALYTYDKGSTELKLSDTGCK